MRARAPFVEDRLVDDGLALDDFGVAVEFDVEHDALAAGEAAGEDLLERGIHFFDGEAGEKTEAAHVDGEDGDAETSGYACGGEERAVATKNEEELRLLGYFFAGESVRGIVKSAGGFGVVESANAACGEPVEQRRDDDLQIRTPRTGNNADSVEGAGWLHAVAILPHGFASVQEIL